MNHTPGIRSAIFLLVLAGGSAGSLEAQGSQGSIVMRSQNVITWWVVDPSSGVAAFHGGDIIAICSGDPSGYDLLDFREVQAPNDVATNLVARGRSIGASLWDPAPPFVMPRLCHDILARGAPIAIGTADITITGRFPVTWADPDVVSPFGMTARATMQTPDGRSLQVNSHYRCVTKPPEMECTQGVTVR